MTPTLRDILGMSLAQGLRVGLGVMVATLRCKLGLLLHEHRMLLLCLLCLLVLVAIHTSANTRDNVNPSKSLGWHRHWTLSIRPSQPPRIRTPAGTCSEFGVACLLWNHVKFESWVYYSSVRWRQIGVLGKMGSWSTTASNNSASVGKLITNLLMILFC